MPSKSTRSPSPARADSVSRSLVRRTSSIHPCVADDPTFNMNVADDPTFNLKMARSISDTGKIAPKQYRAISDAWAFWLFVLSFPLLYFYGEYEKIHHPLNNKLTWVSIDLIILQLTESKHLTFPAIVVGAMFAVLFVVECFPRVAVTVLYFAVPIQSFYDMLQTSNTDEISFRISMAKLVFWLLVSWWSYSKINLKFVAAMISAGSKGLRHNWGVLSIFFILLFLIAQWLVYGLNTISAIDFKFNARIKKSGQSSFSWDEILYIVSHFNTIYFLQLAVTCGCLSACMTMMTSRTISTWYFDYKNKGTINGCYSVVTGGLGTAAFGSAVAAAIRQLAQLILLPLKSLDSVLFGLLGFLIKRIEESVQFFNDMTLTTAGITCEGYFPSALRIFRSFMRDGSKFVTTKVVIDSLIYYLNLVGGYFAVLGYYYYRAKALSALDFWGFFQFLKDAIVTLFLSVYIIYSFVNCLYVSTMTVVICNLEQEELDKQDPANAKRRSRSKLEDEIKHAMSLKTK